MFEWTDWLLEEPGVADNEKFDMVTPTVVRPPAVEVNDNVPSGKPRNVSYRVTNVDCCFHQFYACII